MNYEKLGFLPGWSVQRVAGVVKLRPFGQVVYIGGVAALQKSQAHKNKIPPSQCEIQKLVIKTAKQKQPPRALKV